MTETGQPIHVEDDRAQGRLLVERDGLTARLEYRLEGDRLILVHTEVPDAFEGQGVGSALVRARPRRSPRSDSSRRPLSGVGAPGGGAG